MLLLNYKRQIKKLTSYQVGLKGLIYIGWKTFEIGVFHVNYGGDIVFPLGILMKQVEVTLEKRQLQILNSGRKTKMYLTRGFHRHYGHFQRWAGPMWMKQTSNDISQQMH